jgi:CheY-like chemotaxis protein
MKLRRILVVDDNDDDLFFVQIILKSAGIANDVTLMETGQIALDHLSSPQGQEVDLILLDINMPEMSGFEFLDLYQPLYDQGLAHAAVVMHSSSSAPADRSRASAYGCVRGYVVKPISKVTAQSLVPLVTGSSAAE